MAEKLVEQYPEKFSKNFKNNKEILEEMGLIDDKVVRNKIAGYIISILEKRGS